MQRRAGEIEKQLCLIAHDVHRHAHVGVVAVDVGAPAEALALGIHERVFRLLCDEARVCERAVFDGGGDAQGALRLEHVAEIECAHAGVEGIGVGRREAAAPPQHAHRDATLEAHAHGVLQAPAKVNAAAIGAHVGGAQLAQLIAQRALRAFGGGREKVRH